MPQCRNLLLPFLHLPKCFFFWFGLFHLLIAVQFIHQCKYTHSLSLYLYGTGGRFDGNFIKKKWRNPMKDFNYLLLKKFQAISIGACVCILFECFRLPSSLTNLGWLQKFPEWLWRINDKRQRCQCTSHTHSLIHSHTECAEGDSLIPFNCLPIIWIKCYSWFFFSFNFLTS